MSTFASFVAALIPLSLILLASSTCTGLEVGIRPVQFVADQDTLVLVLLFLILPIAGMMLALYSLRFAFYRSHRRRGHIAFYFSALVLLAILLIGMQVIPANMCSLV